MLRFLWLVLCTLLLASSAQAATINFNGGTVNGCAPPAAKTYTCGTAFIGANDTASIFSGYTVIVNGAFQLGSGQGLKMSGTARLETSGSGNILLTGANAQNISITGGTIKAGGNFSIGGGASNITADIIAATITNTGEAANIKGSLTATGDISLATSTVISGSVSGAAVNIGYANSIGGAVTATGAVNLGGATTVTGAVSGASIITGSNATIGGALAITNNIQLGSSTRVSGAVSGASITADADVAMGSTLTVGGAITLGSRTTVAGAVAGDSIVTNSDVKLNSTLKIKGAIDLSSGNTIAGAVTGASIRTNSGTTLNSSLKVDGLAELGSAITVLGGVRAAEVTTISPVKNITGGITADKSITIASGSTVSGDVNAPTSTLDNSSSVVTGNINATTLLTLGSSSRVNGDIVAPRVITKDSVTINGNAAVGYIYLDGNATVSKVITCTGSTPGPGQAPCTCVERPSWYNYNPTCAAAAPSGAHHFQITHGGSALTCQPQTVTVTACANAACTAPHYTGSTTITLQPGGKSFTFTGSTASATVEQSTAGVATLGAPAASASVSCLNTSNVGAANQCAMTFDDTGLVVNVNNHIAMTTANVSIQALTASANKQSCVPLVAGKSADIALSCAFVNPGPGTANSEAQVTIDASALSCGSGSIRKSLAFNSSGLATTTLTYPEVGQVALTAAYAGSASYTVRGTGSFVAAPARFAIAAASAKAAVAAGTVVTADSPVFARAGEGFAVSISAVNDKNVVTKNFGKENTAENFKFASPAVDNPAGVGNLGTIVAGAWGAISNGVATTLSSSQWTFSDVGIIRLDATLANSSGYLGLSDFKTTGSQKIGRFIPDHFDTALPADAGQDATMPCAASGGTPLVTPCVQRFIYSHQPFRVVVKAYNSANAITSNYEASLARAVTLGAFTASGGASAVTVGAMTGSVAGTAPVFGFTKGVGTVSGTNLPVFAFAPKPTATTGTRPTQFYVRATDADQVTSQRTAAVEQPVTAVSGRLLVPNVDGSPSSSMPVTVQAQFYAPDRGGYVFNPAYTAAAPALPGFMRFDHCQKGLASNAATFACTGAAQLQLVAPAPAAFTAGKTSLRLAPPAPGNVSGSVDLTLLQPCAAGATCVQWIDYLPSTTGKLTFGVYRSGPVIYTREVY